MNLRKKLIFIVCSMLMFISFGFSGASASAATIIGFGDSNTEGSNFYSLYPNELDQRWVVQTGAINAGKSGNTIIQGYNRYRDDVLLKRPDYVTIMFGMVDMVLDESGNPATSKLDFENTLNKMVDWAESYGITPILMTEPPVHQTLFYDRYPHKKEIYNSKGGVRLWANSYNEITRKVARERGVTLIDNYANFVLKAGGATDAQLWASGLIDSTGTHMTPRGHGVVTYSVNYYSK
ncbi:SGNH/GDSL hydrolase family protein [Cytobacillus pseudoceanisediminis]|uniref:SGNH/GDSL hydrolase family protein n=1 Tax=Cytobacillus pseudoceanisediminis TaxID=3051614 RepID=UPI003C2ED700